MADIEAFCFHRPAGEACLTAKEIRTLDVQAWADSGPTNSQEEVLIDGFGFSVTKQEIWNEKQAIIKDLGLRKQQQLVNKKQQMSNGSAVDDDAKTDDTAVQRNFSQSRTHPCMHACIHPCAHQQPTNIENVLNNY